MTFLALQTLPAPNPDVSLTLLAPELLVSIAGIIVMLVDAFTRRSDRRWLTGGISLAGLFAAGGACVWLWRVPHAVHEAYNGMIVLDMPPLPPLRLAFTIVFIVVAALTVLLSMI